MISDLGRYIITCELDFSLAAQYSEPYAKLRFINKGT